MARNGSGTMALLATMAPANTVSNSATVNSIMEDIADALTDSINKDGTKAFAANQSFGGFKATSVGNGTAAGDAVNAGQVQAGRLNWADGGGTADAITASYTPAVTSVTDGDLFYVRATAANATTTPTFTPNSGTVTARTIVKQANAALAAGDIAGDGHELILRYRASDTKYELLNPKGTSFSINGLTEETAVDTADFVGGYDTSGTAERKFSVNNLHKAVNTFTAETAVAVDDVVGLYDTSASTMDKATVQNVLKAINGLTEDTTPDTSADFILTYDTSATDVKKVKPSNLSSAAAGTAVFLGSVTVSDTTNTDVTGIATTYSSFLIIYTFAAESPARNLQVALSSNNGSSYGTARVVATTGTAGAFSGGSFTISDVKNNGTSKTITKYGAGLNDVDSTPATSSATGTVTEAVVTGLINALRFNHDSSTARSTVTIFGIV